MAYDVADAARPAFPRTDELAVRSAGVRWLTVLAMVVVVGILPGPENSLIWTGIITTLWQPWLCFASAWSGWRPATPWRSAALVGGFAACTAATLVLGCLLVADLNLSVLGSYFPVLIAPGALLFVTFLQFTMVWERKPFERLGTPWAGLAALGLAAVIAVIAYELLVNWSALPTTDRPPGLRDPHGPLPGASVSTLLIVVAAWQVIVMVVALGYPGRLAGGTLGRIVTNNVTIVVGASITMIVADSLGTSGPALAAGAGCVVAGGRLPFCLYRELPDPRGTMAVRFFYALTCSVLIYTVLRLVADTATFDRQPPGLWIAVVALNLVSGGITFAGAFVGGPLQRRFVGAVTRGRT